MRYQAVNAKSSAFVKNAALAMLAAVSATAFAAPAHAAGTAAGTTISNTATATYDLPSGGSGTIQSNTVTLKVDELIDVTVAWRDPSDVIGGAGAPAQVLSFTVANGGNGTEGYTLGTVASLGGDDFDPAITAILLDTNGNGAYDPGVDTVYVPGTNDPQLAPDQSATVFVLSTLPLAANDGHRGRAQLTAASKKGVGAPGTSFAGLGQGGGNAVVGATGGKGFADGWYKVQKAAVAFVKTASIADPFGGTTQVPGATITYTLAASVSGTGSLANLKVTDNIPTGTTYSAGSITLDGAALTDAADADAGSFGGSGIAVNLGTVASGATRTVTFKVKIN
jgi:fimbrial isopeptide formation D2 family protein